jgi:hypothetical protein
MFEKFLKDFQKNSEEFPKLFQKIFKKKFFFANLYFKITNLRGIHEIDA